MNSGPTAALGAAPLRSRPRLRVVERNETAFTLSVSDNNTWQKVTQTGATVVTIPPMPQGWCCLVSGAGSGTALLTFSPMTGTNCDLQARGGDTIKNNAQFSRASLFAESNMVIAIDGDLTVTA
jgi:hypothetical protein